MLYFPALKTTATTFEQAEACWERSQEAYTQGSVDGQRWLTTLLWDARDGAPDEHFRRHYDEQLRQATCLLAVMAAPPAAGRLW